MGLCLSKNQLTKLGHCLSYPAFRFFFKACCCKYLCCFACSKFNRERRRNNERGGATVAVDYDETVPNKTAAVGDTQVNSTWAKLISIDDSQHIIVKDNSCTLGRADTVTNKINDPRISSQHCTIRRDGAIFLLKR